jgi:excisionase family DNA binding protein
LAMHDLEPLLGVQETARILKMRPSGIYKLVQDGRLPHYRIARNRLRFSREHIAKYLRECERGA